MVEIPQNTKDNTQELVDNLTRDCLAQLEKRSTATMSWQKTTREIARKVAQAFIDKGYHASEYITRYNGWATTTISTGPQSSEESPMSYVRVLG